MSRLSVIPAAALEDVAEKRMTLTDLRVLCGLGACTNRNGWATDTNQARIAQKAGLVRETVNRSLNKLEQLGWVEVYESQNRNSQLIGLLCYRVILDPPFGPDGERLESQTYQRRRTKVPDAQAAAAEDAERVTMGEEDGAQSTSPGREGLPDEEVAAQSPELSAGQGLPDTPCDVSITGGGVTPQSQGGCDVHGHRGCDVCSHNRVDSSIDKRSMSTSARRMARGQRVDGCWFNRDIELAGAIDEAKAKASVQGQLVELLGRDEAYRLSEGMDVRAYVERGFMRWAMVCVSQAKADALRDALRRLGKGVSGPTGSRVQIITEGKWARTTAEITMPYAPPDGVLGQLFDQAIECGRSETDLAPCCEDGFVLVEDPEYGWAVRSTGMSSREIGQVFIGAIKALGWNPDIKPLAPVERLIPAKETAHG